MVKSKKVDHSNELTNWYEQMPSSMKPNYINPHYENHKLTWPFRGILNGASGSGKSTLVLELIKRMPDTIDKIILCIPIADEPLYNYLRTKIKPEQIDVYENGTIPSLEDYNDDDNTDQQLLIIFDDLVNTPKAQPKIVEWFIRGRKVAGGVSCLYVSQTWFGIPKAIRLNVSWIMIKKLKSLKDLRWIMKDHSLDLEQEEMMLLYDTATKNKGDFLMIDCDADEMHRFRHNFKPFIN